MTPEERAAYMKKYNQEHRVEIAAKKREYRRWRRAEHAEYMRKLRERQRHQLDLNEERAARRNIGIGVGVIPLGLALDLATELGPFPCRVIAR